MVNFVGQLVKNCDILEPFLSILVKKVGQWPKKLAKKFVTNSQVSCEFGGILGIFVVNMLGIERFWPHGHLFPILW